MAVRRRRPPNSLFLNIVEQESMNNREEARRQGISPWGISSEAAGCLGQVKEI